MQERIHLVKMDTVILNEIYWDEGFSHTQLSLSNKVKILKMILFIFTMSIYLRHSKGIH